MKNKASKFLKQLFSVMVTVIKSKSLAVKTKTAAFKTRFMILGLLRNKRVLMTTISHKMNSLMTSEKAKLESGCGNIFEVYTGAIVPRNIVSYCDESELEFCDEEEEDEYPDFTHSLFKMEECDGDDDDDDDEFDLGLDSAGSVIDLVKSSRENGCEFNLEEEIDHVADVFIRRVHKQRRMQKHA